MKKKALLIPLVCLFAYVIFSSHSGGPALTAALDCTGATSSASSGCGGATCHGTAPNDSIYNFPQVITPGGTVVTEYTPGMTYIIRLKGQNLSYSVLPKFGYQFSIVKVGTSISAGTFLTSPGIHSTTIGTVRVSEQNSPISCSGSGGYGTFYQVDIPWVAPAPGTGTLTLRGIINAVNNSGTAEAADHWPTGSPVYLPEGPMALIGGPSSMCTGDSTTLTAYAPGGSGTWTSYDPSVATVSSTGKVIAINPGAVVIGYETSLATTSTVINVNPTPVAITGIRVVCQGGTTTLADATAGGTWISSDPTLAAIGSATGVATNASGSAGTATITYKMPSSTCYTTVPVTVALSASVTGSSSACAGSSTPFTHPFPGGIWYSSNTSVATVGPSGMVTGVAAGTSLISYSLSTTGCDATKVVTVNSTPVAAISGSSTVCFDHTITLTGIPAGGTWSSSDASKVVVNSYTGEVTGVSNGTANIMYSVPSSCGPGTATNTVTTSSTGPCTSGINPFALSNEMRIFPNPNRGAFSLNVLATTGEEAHIIVTNIVGAKVREFTIKTNEVNDITLHEPPGNYFLSATTLNSKYFVKIVVE